MKTKLTLLLVASSLLAVAAQSFTNNVFFDFQHWENRADFLILKVGNIVKKVRTTNVTDGGPYDHTMTNVFVQSSHEPVIVGKTNGYWIIHFK